MYCAGFWGEGVCTADMEFISDPTARNDAIAGYARIWYEKHRESAWDRCFLSKNQQLLNSGCADEFMLSFISEVHRVEEEAKRRLGLK